MTSREAIAGAIALTKGRVARGSIASLALKVTGLGLIFLQAILAARLFGPSGFGTIAIALSLAQVASIFALFGLHSHAVIKIAADGAHHRYAAIASYMLKATGIAIGLSLLVGAAFVLRPPAILPNLFSKLDGLIFVAALLVPAVVLLQLFRGFNQGFGRVAEAQLPSDILRPCLVVIALGAVSLSGALMVPYDYLLISILAHTTAVIWAGVGLFRHAARLNRSEQVSPSPSTFDGAPVRFFVLTLLATLYGELGTLSLSLLSTTEQAGLFQPIARLIPLLAIMNAAALMPFAPRITELWSLGRRSDVASLTAKFTASVSALTTANVLAIGILAPFVLMVFGPEYTYLAPYIWLVGLAQIIGALCGPVGKLLVTTGHTSQVALGHVIGLAAGAVSAFYLVPSLGAIGATIAVSINIVTWNVVLLFAVWRTLGFDPSLLGAIRNITMKDRAAA